MRAVVVSEPGGPEVLQVADVPEPDVRPHDVLVDVAATAVNRADVMQRLGHYPPPAGAPAWPGLECSGTVAAVGDCVSDWTVGDLVCAVLSGGGYAERVAVPAGQVLTVPAGLGLVEAAALPEVTCTVWSNLAMVAGLRAGEVLLVHGGSSGIGTMAVQVARRLGARVAVTAGTAEKLDRCAALGAEILVNYREQDFVERVRAGTGGHGADVVLDNMGAAYLARNVDVLATGGRCVVIGLQGGRRAELDLGLLLAKRGAVFATALRSRPEAEKAAIVAAVRDRVWPWVEAGDVVPVIHTTLPLAEAAEAHRLVESSAHVGKVLLTL